MKISNISRARIGAKIDRAFGDARKIVSRFRAGATFDQLAREYGAWNHVRRIIHRGTTKQERIELKANKIRKTKAARGQLWKAGHRDGGALKAFPIGSIVSRKCERGRRRWIKVDDRGTLRENWMLFAAFVWLIENRRAFVPAGLKIVHCDGDSMNDLPSNIKAISISDSMVHLRQIRPASEVKRRKNVARARRLRAEISREGELIAMKISIRQCASCGFEPAKRSCDRCPKCGSSAFESIESASMA